MGGFRSDIEPNITHTGKLAHTPERRHLTLLEALAKRGDALCGECADANWGYTAEHVAVQAARDKQ